MKYSLTSYFGSGFAEVPESLALHVSSTIRNPPRRRRRRRPRPFPGLAGTSAPPNECSHSSPHPCQTTDTAENDDDDDDEEEEDC
jgi:hypothetical protein